MSLNIQDVHFEMNNSENHTLAYMLESYPKILDSHEPKVGQFAYYDPRSNGHWIVEVQTLNGIMSVGCVMSSPYQVVPVRHITCHGKILKIISGPHNSLNRYFKQ